MRLELLDDRTRAFVLALVGDARGRNHQKLRPSLRGRSSERAEARDTPKDHALHTLAKDLIENQCGSHSLGLIYEFLLNTYGTPAKARAEFERYLSGQWSSEWIQAARLAVRPEEAL
jgi:hypothetical protein